MSALDLPLGSPIEVTRLALHDTLALQRAAYLAQPIPSLAQRRSDLRRLQAYVREHRDALVAAVSADYGHRSSHETLFTEIFTVIDGVDHVLKHLKSWMKPQRRHVDLMNFFGAKNRVIPQPLGVVGAIVPWNFPINLAFTGLIYTFAAGNRAMVKMSENSRHLAQYLIQTMPAYFATDKLAFFDETGGVGVEFSQLKFDHLLFTGSGQTGRAVMAAAAQNLCPVTLELGGKSPAVVCDDFPLRTAVERLLYVKCLNAGQICTTIDYAYVPVGKIDAKIAPHLVLNAPAHCALLQREIFGPILPLLAYTALEDVVQAINQRPRPLAMYPFSHDGAQVQMLIDRIMSGGVSVNDGLFHVAQHDLPFGGVGDSGMGHYHGYEGFVTFSKMRPVFYQARFSAAKFLWPPYTTFASKYLRFLTK